MSLRLSTIIQRRTHQAGFIRRHVSSSASKKVKSHRTPPPAKLPPAKLRALISLYHQADTFITPETLSDRINEAFVSDEKLTGIARTAGDNLKDIATLLTDIREKPKFTEWDRTAMPALEVMSTWSSSFDGGREWKVIEALYGVNISPSHKVLLGLDTLEESAESEHQDSKSWEDMFQYNLRKNGQSEQVQYNLLCLR
jgi:hypothetical protein